MVFKQSGEQIVSNGKLNDKCCTHTFTQIKNDAKCMCSRDRAPTSAAPDAQGTCLCPRDEGTMRPPSPPILMTEASDEDQEEYILKCTCLNSPLPRDSSSFCPRLPQICPGSSKKTGTSTHQSHTDSSTPRSSSDPGRQTGSAQSSPRSCLRKNRRPSKFKSVRIQVPEMRNKSQECVEAMLNNSQTEGQRNREERHQHREDYKDIDESALFRDLSGGWWVDALRQTLECCRAEKVDVSVRTDTDSGGALSLVDSAIGSCDANARATYYHNKLLSTLQILQNKEETIRVQTESLAVAEERISALTERALELKRELERKSKELDALRQTLECCRAEKVDVSVRTDTEVEKQTDIMNTLQSNLSVIEDLYRECFYETAKQEDLIDMLRKSYLDVRLMDKQKQAQIGRLQTVINTQKWSLDRCQDIAQEVDNLKMEISNFLSSSASTNNDSGMWERSEESFASGPEVHEELQEVIEQLLRLRELLTDPCTCGLQNENKRLKQDNEALQTRISDFFSRKCELEKMLEDKDALEREYKEEIATKEEQLNFMRRELTTMTNSSRGQTSTCEQLTTQLRQAQVLLGDKSEELVRMQQQCDTQQETIDELREELKKAEDLFKENCTYCTEVSSLTAQVAQWRAQLADSERRVRKLDCRLRQVQSSYREKESKTAELQAALEQAHARGAALCGDVRRVVCATRHWARRVRDARREQEEIIKEKEDLIATLRERLQSRVGKSKSMQCMCPNPDEELPCPASNRQMSCPRLEAIPSRFLSTCEDEVAGCSSAPTPPRRWFRKKKNCGHTRCPANSWLCDASQQHPILSDGCQDPKDSCYGQPGPSSPCAGNISPSDELFRRMEQVSDALADGFRRWTRSDAR